jgi:16S rRNA (guanine527-N7)-methyltransferase
MIENTAEYALLQSGITELALTLDDSFIEAIFHFTALLAKWNRVYNLTGITDEQETITKHILDSLAILPYLQGNTFIDVGSGAGFPGIPLALADPSRQWILLDSTEKRIRFLRQAKQVLSLNNVEIIHNRAEHYHPTDLFDGVVTRAFRHLPTMIEYCDHLKNHTGALYAMKGHLTPEEEHILMDYQHELLDIQVPYLNQVRQLIIIRNRTS